MNTSEDFKPVPTRAALALQNKTTEFQALVFEEPRTTKPHRSGEEQNNYNKDKEHQYGAAPSQYKKEKRKNEPEEFDIKKARHEVLNFAMSNQRIAKNSKKMQIFQAVKLGAKPPKKACKNYKDLLGERKRLKQIREERKKFHQLGKNQTGAASVKCRSKTKMEKQKKKRAPVSSIDQHYGVVKPKLKKK